MATLQKIKFTGYKVVLIWVCEFRKLLGDKPGLENKLYSQHYVKNSPINIRDALYGGRTEATKTWYNTKQGEEIHNLNVITVYPCIFRYGVFTVRHPEVYVCRDCPAEFWYMEGII